MNIDKNYNNSKNLEVNEETSENPLINYINNVKRSKSEVKMITQNSDNNRNDTKFEVLEPKPISVFCTIMPRVNFGTFFSKK